MSQTLVSTRALPRIWARFGPRVRSRLQNTRFRAQGAKRGPSDASLAGSWTHFKRLSPVPHGPTLRYAHSLQTIYSKGCAVSLQNPDARKYCVAVHNRTLDHQGEEKAFQNNVALILKSLDELLTCDHSIKTY